MTAVPDRLPDRLPDRRPVRPWTPGPTFEWSRWWDARPLDDVLRPAARQGFVLSAAQLAALGVSRSAARHAVRLGRWYRAGRGYVGVVDVREPAGSSHLEQRRRHALAVAAACLARPDHASSARSAAILYGLPTLSVPGTAELTLAEAPASGQLRRAHVYAAGVPLDAVAERFGIDVLTVARTVVDVARHDRFDGIVVADAALRDRLTTLAELDRVLATAVGWPGVCQARQIVALASPLSESPIESLLRLRMHEDGFPAPTPQYYVNGYWVDLALPDHGLLIEADGRTKYTDDELWREKRREQALRLSGFWVERVTMSDVLGGWPETSRRLRRAMRSDSRPRWPYDPWRA